MAGMWIKACLNGARRPSEHPALPTTPAALAAEAVAAAAAGARAVHLHAKDADGADTLAASAVDAAVQAVRDAAPQLPVGVTTGAWAMPDPAQRVSAVRSWSVLPDFASVNWSEDGADAVAAALLERGIAVEAGLFHASAAAAWAASPSRHECLRLMIELRPGDRVREEADDLLARLRTVDADTPVLLHSGGRSAWEAVEHAARRGLQTRIGFEDTLTLPDGTSAPGNAALVAAALELATSVEPA
jgi:uncharacterized protein (DUF849 family)